MRGLNEPRAMTTPTYCMWCNTPFDTLGQPMCGCALIHTARATYGVEERMTADRLLDQRLSTLEQRAADFDQRVTILSQRVASLEALWHAKPVATLPTPAEVHKATLRQDEQRRRALHGQYAHDPFKEHLPHEGA